MESPALSVNFFRGRKGKFFDKFLTWALTAGRVVVILTEGVALAAFLFRFSLDKQLVDLHDAIKNNRIIVSNLQQNEATYRTLQDKLALIGKLSKESKLPVNIITDFVKAAPSDVVINNITYQSDHAELTATLSSLDSLLQFLNMIKNYPGVTDVNLGNIQNRISSGSIDIDVNITFVSTQIGAPAQ